MKKLAALTGLFVGLAVLANWLASAYTVNVPLTPYIAPAGVFAVGAVLVLRDWIQQAYGLLTSWTLVAVASLISLGIGELAGWTTLQKIALASFVAFLVSETLESVIFTPFRRRYTACGVALSGVVGGAVDSYVFLSLAFGSLAFFPGQFIAKTEMVLVGAALTLARRRFFPVEGTM